MNSGFDENTIQFGYENEEVKKLQSLVKKLEIQNELLKSRQKDEVKNGIIVKDENVPDSNGSGGLKAGCRTSDGLDLLEDCLNDVGSEENWYYSTSLISLQSIVLCGYVDFSYRYFVFILKV